MEPTQISEKLLAEAQKNSGTLSFRDFIKIALFAPECGYYTRAKKRVGTGPETDFYTAVSAGGALFGTLIRSAAQTLLGGDAREFTLVEIGAEPTQSHFEAQRDFFAGIRTIRVGEPLEIPEKAVVVANELLDAQPFHRLVFKDGAWREIGVFYSPEKAKWFETLLPKISTGTLENFIANELPARMEEDWHLDISLDAENLLREIFSKKWHGAAIFLDYGKTLKDCLEMFPAGTARAYRRHAQTGTLAENPGEQDLTCHVFWDRLEKIAHEAGFAGTRILRQEAFLMRYALPAVQAIIDSGTRQHTREAMRERAKLLELIHPANMGHAFQVLAGTRNS